MSDEEIKKAFENRFRFKMAGKPYTEEIKALCRDFFEAGVFCASGDVKMIGRAENFKEEVMSFTQYPLELLTDFYNYWSEPNRSGTKMRCELQKTWDTKRRLATWAKNDYNHYGRNNNTQRESSRLNKFANLLTGE